MTKYLISIFLQLVPLSTKYKGPSCNEVICYYTNVCTIYSIQVKIFIKGGILNFYRIFS